MQILNILDNDQLKHAQNLLTKINFRDGKKTAKGLAKDVKTIQKLQKRERNMKKYQNIFIKFSLKVVG